VGDSGEALLVASEDRYTDMVARVCEIAAGAPQPVRAGVEAAVELAEVDPEGVRAALWRLQADWPTLERLEERVGGEPVRAALGIGAAIQLARSELSSPSPQLRRRLPELLEWLGGAG
jgi:hypothetical protein